MDMFFGTGFIPGVLIGLLVPKTTLVAILMDGDQTAPEGFFKALPLGALIGQVLGVRMWLLALVGQFLG